MPSPYDLIQMINRQFSHNPRDTIEEVNELISDIDKDPKNFAYELSKELEDFSEKLNLCPLCGSNVVELDVEYESSEYFGQPVQERISRYGCEISSCGYIKD